MARWNPETEKGAGRAGVALPGWSVDLLRQVEALRGAGAAAAERPEVGLWVWVAELANGHEPCEAQALARADDMVHHLLGQGSAPAGGQAFGYK